ncbi:MAG: caspase family protein, partial [Hyphomicrobium sp.]
MTTRRDVLVGIGAGLAIAPLPLIAGPVGAQGARPPIRLHALIVGINAYGGRSRRENGGTGRSELVPIKSLRGCLNDARAIETAVRPIAASVRLLTETQATRAAFLAAWREAVAGANSGDTILLTFSGHGGLESERRAADKPTGHNPALLFHGFDVTQTPNQADRVVSYEIKDMVQAARDKGVRVVFVADCCHAGTLTRSLDAAVVDMVTYRTIGN